MIRFFEWLDRWTDWVVEKIDGAIDFLFEPPPHPSRTTEFPASSPTAAPTPSASHPGGVEGVRGADGEGCPQSGDEVHEEHGQEDEGERPSHLMLTFAARPSGDGILEPGSGGEDGCAKGTGEHRDILEVCLRKDEQGRVRRLDLVLPDDVLDQLDTIRVVEEGGHDHLRRVWWCDGVV